MTSTPVRVADLIAQARDLLNDTFDPPRWPATQLLTYYNEARQRIWQFRPDAFYVTRIVTAWPGHVLNDQQAIDVLATYETMIVNYIVARALSQDAEHAANATMSQFFGGTGNGQ